MDALVVEELAKRVEELELLVFALGLGSALVVNLVFGGWFAEGRALGLGQLLSLTPLRLNPLEALPRRLELQSQYCTPQVSLASQADLLQMLVAYQGAVDLFTHDDALENSLDFLFCRLINR